jgi:hypothetical protein
MESLLRSWQYLSCSKIQCLLQCLQKLLLDPKQSQISSVHGLTFRISAFINISVTFSAAHSRNSGKFTLNKASSKSGMKVLVDSIRTETPRPRSPHMNNEEPIELAHFPAAKRPGPGEKPKIERDDFPAPPYPYTDPGKYDQNCIQ